VCVVCVCVWCVCVCVYVCVSVFLCVSLYLCVFMFVCLCLKALVVSSVFVMKDCVSHNAGHRHEGAIMFRAIE